jgi:hypothetical protein
LVSAALARTPFERIVPYAVANGVVQRDRLVDVGHRVAGALTGEFDDGRVIAVDRGGRLDVLLIGVSHGFYS